MSSDFPYAIIKKSEGKDRARNALSFPSKGDGIVIALPHQSIGFNLPPELPLLALKGVGMECAYSGAYSWNNRGRNESFCLFQYCMDGEGVLEMDGITYPVHKNEAFLIEIPGESHYYLPQHSSHWEFVFLEFTKECLPLARKIHRMAGPVIPFGENSGLLTQALDIYNLALQDALHSYFENSRVSYDFWMRLAEYALSLPGRERSKADDAKAYLDQHYGQSSLSLDEIADHLGISKYSLCREFHKKYGITVGRYLRELRISQACRLLMTQNDNTLQQIAELVGFANDNYFGKVFKAAKGISPDRYRRQTGRYDLVRTVYPDGR